MNRDDHSRSVKRFALMALLALVPIVAVAASSQISLAQLQYRPLGVFGNRTTAVAGIPGRPLVMFIGAASGGIWRTLDGGMHWKPVFDSEPVQAIGALAVAPSSPNIVWAGTGESSYIRPMTSMGDGVYKSVDEGTRWKNMGLRHTGRIARIVIDPQNANIVYVCAAGDGYRKQKARGVFRTENGGQTWHRVLFVNGLTGCSDLSLDARDPNVIYAGMWRWLVRPWDLDSGGAGSGVYVSRNGGTSWVHLTGHGLPSRNVPVGKTAVQIAPSDPDRVYALIQGAGFFRSNDGGRSWVLINRSHKMNARPTYFTRFAVAPNDPNKIYFVSMRLMTSINGGVSLKKQKYGGDNHDIWIDPQNPKRIMLAADLGTVLTLNGFKTWRTVALPIAQIYHVYTDNAAPYNVYGNRQDGTSYRGPSNSLESTGITMGMWTTVGGCESGFTVPTSATTGYSGCWAGGIDRYDTSNGHAQNVSPKPIVYFGWPPASVPNRWNWTIPIAVSTSKASRAVYVGSQYVYRSTDHGQSWERISPDLTKNDKSAEQSSGGLTIDNLMTFSPETLSSIAVSHLNKKVIWVGSNDGLVHVTTDGGKHWVNVTRNIPKLKPWSAIANIQPSYFTAGTAYVAANRFMMGDYAPYIYKTTDYGQHWVKIVSGIPRSKLSYVHVVTEDPDKRGLLFAGTDNGIYFSLNGGKQWKSLQLNLPRAPVYWLTVQPRRDDLVVATYGRGIWILDDVGVLNTLLAVEKDPRRPVLFKPRRAIRFRDKLPIISRYQPRIVGKNPPSRSDIDYYLPRGEYTSGSVELSIFRKGRLIASFDNSDRSAAPLPAKPGINRFWWNLRYRAPRMVILRTPPPGAPWVHGGAAGTRTAFVWGVTDPLESENVAPLVNPGKYTVTLRVDGHAYSKTLLVVKDPNTRGTVRDIFRQNALALRVVRAINGIVSVVDRSECVRARLLAGGAVDAEGKREASPKNSASQARLRALEGTLIDIYHTGAEEDMFRTPVRPYGQLYWLLSRVAAQSSDYAPTSQQVAAFKLLQRQATTREAALKAGLELVATAGPEMRCRNGAAENRIQ